MARFYLVAFQNAKENEEWELLGFAEGIFVVGLSMRMEEAAVKLGCEVSGCLEVKLMSWTVLIKVAVLELYEYLWYCCGHSQPFRVFYTHILDTSQEPNQYETLWACV